MRTFHADADFEFYRTLLLDVSREEGCAIHAWVLMPNHVHLLMTPTYEKSASGMMHRVGLKYVRFVNTKYNRTGTLYEGRFRSSLVTTERYVLTCARYIELNPVRAGLVHDAKEFRWSSHRHHACGIPDPLVTSHSVYERLGATPDARQREWIMLCEDETLPLQFEQIRKAVRAPHSRVDARVGTEYMHAAVRLGNVATRFRT